MSPPIFALRSFSLVARVHTLPFTLRDEPRAGLRAAGDGRSAFGGVRGLTSCPRPVSSCSSPKRHGHLAIVAPLPLLPSPLSASAFTPGFSRSANSVFPLMYRSGFARYANRHGPHYERRGASP